MNSKNTSPLNIISYNSISGIEIDKENNRNISLVYQNLPSESIAEIDRMNEILEQNYDIPDDIPILYNPKTFGKGKNSQNKLLLASKLIFTKKELSKELNFGSSKSQSYKSMKKDSNKIEIFSDFGTIAKRDNSTNSIKIKNIEKFRKLIFSIEITQEEFVNYLLHIYRSLKYFPINEHRYNDFEQYIELEKPQKGIYKTLFLDLDETLVHCCSKNEKSEFTIKIAGDGGKIATIRLNIRPLVKKFLDEISRFYQIFIFTAASYAYANVIANFLDPQVKYISGILDRTYCRRLPENRITKDLRIIRNRDLKNIVIVDNMPHNFMFQIDNGIPVKSWFNDYKDRELKNLADYLIDASFKDDIRAWNREQLKIEKLLSFSEQDIEQANYIVKYI